MDNKRILIWFRNDLRVHDHEALYKASLKNKELLPVYIIDPRVYSNSYLGIPRVGPYRRRFIAESIDNLRQNLRALGGELYVRTGSPEDLLPELVKAFDVDTVYAHKEQTTEETSLEQNIEETLRKKGILVQWFEGNTLIHPTELPFPLKFLPDIFTEFRKQVEKTSKIAEPFPTPVNLKVPGGIQIGNIDIPKSTEAFGVLPDPGGQNLGGLEFTGGENAALERLDNFIWKSEKLCTYKETRNGSLGLDYSSKFSPWLAIGSLSPRYIYQQVKLYEQTRTKNDSTYWLIFELLWRDYFKFVAKKFGKLLFRPTGIRNVEIKHINNAEHFNRWALGQTGMPFVDASMKELLATGFMSNRGRQNVASYFVKDLGLNWQLGAAWFEYLLVDYDAASNWGNWNYIAGCGNDPRENRHFNIAKQAETYDHKGLYIKTWLPELSKAPAYRLNHVDSWSVEEQAEYNVTLGITYPFPIETNQKILA